jgi:phenylacetate-CoA ligase
VVIVRLVAGPTYTDQHTQHLITELKNRLGDDVRVEVQLVDRLERSANGKFKWVISHVPLGI